MTSFFFSLPQGRGDATGGTGTVDPGRRQRGVRTVAPPQPSPTGTGPTGTQDGRPPGVSHDFK